MRSVRVRWFRGPVGRELTELISSDMRVGSAPVNGSEDVGADADDVLLRSLVQGRTNAEIAQELGHR